MALLEYMVLQTTLLLCMQDSLGNCVFYSLVAASVFKQTVCVDGVCMTTSALGIDLDAGVLRIGGYVRL